MTACKHGYPAPCVYCSREKAGLSVKKGCRHQVFEWAQSTPNLRVDDDRYYEAKCRICRRTGWAREVRELRNLVGGRRYGPPSIRIEWWKPKPEPKPVPNRGALEARW